MLVADKQGIELLLAGAAQAHRAGRMAEAAGFAERALERDGRNLSAKFLLGVTYARTGETIRARQLLTEVVDAEPTAFEALISLSTLAREASDHNEAIAWARRAVLVRAGDVVGQNNLGRCLLDARKLEEAADAFIRSSQLQPGFAPAHYNLGKVRQLQGKDGEAAEAFAKAVAISPSLENLLALGHMLLVLCDYHGARGCATQCTEKYPDSSAAQLLLCGALIELGGLAEAEVRLQKAITLDPQGDEALQLAARMRPLGYIDEANDCLRRAIERNPRQISAYDALIQNHRVTEEDRPLVIQLLSISEQGGLSPTEIVSLHFGLGKALEDLGDYEESMGHYDAANELARELKMSGATFDREDYAGRIDRLIDLFSDGHRVEDAVDSDLPILIVGMMRSGTTLAEQVLSSHPEVKDAGEQLFWSRNAGRALVTEPGVDHETASLGREYVAELTAIGGGSRHVTDKMPGNYMFLGLIHQVLPNARIIHMRRSPVDNCLSIWTTPNHMPHEGGHVKTDIVFVYQQYLRLMEHWRKLLPADRLLEIDYEQLVSDPEQTTRRMIEFCGLEWNEACLHPESNRRIVRTPSAWQVRQPVYKTSISRWRRFAQYLGDFRELVDNRTQ